MALLNLMTLSINWKVIDMMRAKTIGEAIGEVGPTFSLGGFGRILQPLIIETLEDHNKRKFRKGTILIGHILMWVVLSITIRRDLAYGHVFGWMLKGFRWLKPLLPAKNQLLSNGTISKARAKLGFLPLKSLFDKLTNKHLLDLPADFYHWVSMGFDGSTATVPDSEANREFWTKPNRGKAAFPQLRMMVLMALGLHLILDIDYAPYSGKKTGERTLMMKILARILPIVTTPMLFLLDGGLYSFHALYTITQAGHDLITKASSSMKLIPIKYLSDGSYLAVITGRIEDPTLPPLKPGQKRWKKVEITVRVITLHIKGFRPVRLITTILDENITAREIAEHYHVRWEIEIAFDEIKTHQCATLRGQLATTFRSKRPDLVQQELYATVIMYNAVRLIIAESAKLYKKEAMKISFLDSLQHLIDMAPTTAALDNDEGQERWNHLLELIADSQIDRPRRPRVAPRVVKVNRSGYRTKKADDKSEIRDFKTELTIIPHPDSSPSEDASEEVLSKQKEDTSAHKLLQPDPFYHNKHINY